MRKIFAAIVFVSLAIAGCKKNGAKNIANVDQDIVYQEEVEIPIGGPIPIPIPGGIDTAMYYAFATNYQSYLSEYNTSSDKAIHAKMKKLSMRITSAGTQNFDFMDSIKVYVVGKNGLPDQLVADKVPVPKGTQFVEMDVVGQNLKEYFLQDSMYVRLQGRINALPQLNTKINLSTTFNLLANPLN